MGDRMSRREFLRAAGRAIVLGGLGLLAFRLLRRTRMPGRPGAESCINEGVCRNCAAFAGCGLPSALSAKQRAPWARGRS